MTTRQPETLHIRRSAFQKTMRLVVTAARTSCYFPPTGDRLKTRSGFGCRAFLCLWICLIAQSACRTQLLLEKGEVDLAAKTDISDMKAVADLSVGPNSPVWDFGANRDCGSNQILVIPCCGGGIQPFCEPKPPYCLDIGACNRSTASLCACLNDQDPCFALQGSNGTCSVPTTSQIECLCF